uniref:Fibronectin type-III domain-containing protein n=1 Tax=Sander lucioperca TaxID=283035 RepID=A0A8C9Z6E4_SANLU
MCKRICLSGRWTCAIMISTFISLISFPSIRVLSNIQERDSQMEQPKDSTTLMVGFSLKTGATHYIIRIQNDDGFFREDEVSSSPAEIVSLSPYTEYALSIMSANSGGRSQPSLPVTAKTVLPPPQLSTSSPSNDSIIVSWAPVAHAVQYSMSIYDFGSNTNMKHNTSNTNLTISGLAAGSLYAIKGFAWDLEGREGEGSLYINQTTRPPTPSFVNVSIVTSNGVAGLSVSWKLDQDVYGSIWYHVMSDQNRTCNSTSSSCTLLAVGCGEVHTIKVIALNNAGPSFPSSPVVFITFPCPPESLALVESTEGNCTLTWGMVPHADSYVAFFKRGDGTEETCNTTSNNCKYHCLCGYTYLLSVFAYNEAGSSPQGQILNYTTLPCCPEGVSVSVVSTDTLEIMWMASRGAELYQTRAADSSEVILCNDTAPVCALSDLSCDSPYSVLVTPCNEISGCNRACKAHTKDTGRKLIFIDTYVSSKYPSTFDSFFPLSPSAPCMPINLMLNPKNSSCVSVSWTGAHSFITSLTSTRGHARCHTQDSHCLMGCITCGTNYTVTMEAFSKSGHMSNCTYKGFSSSACCPSGVRLYSIAGNSLRVYWRSAGSSHSYITEMVGTSNNSSNYTCTASPGASSCDFGNIQCGDVYHVVVAPLTPEGSKVLFCPQRLYSGMTVGFHSNVWW